MTQGILTFIPLLTWTMMSTTSGINW